MQGEGDYWEYEEFEDPFENFANHWYQVIERIGKLELTPNDVSKWYANFDSAKSIFNIDNSDDSHYSEVGQFTKMNEIEDFLDIAIMEGKTNYRKNERIRLKETYGAISEIVYWFRLIFRTI